MTYEEYKNKTFSERPKVKEEYEKWESKMIFVDNHFCEMMNFALRYAIGRNTYASSDTANYIYDIVSLIDNKTLSVMLRDIEEQEKISIGDEIDEKGWIRLKEKIKKILEKRGVNNADH